MGQIKCGMMSKVYCADNRRSTFDAMNESVLYKGDRPDVVFIGDSITEGWDLNVYFRKGYMLNRGIGGDVVEGVAFRFDADVVQLKPHACVMLIGINDVSALDTMAGKEKSEKGAYSSVFGYIDDEYIKYLIPYYEEIMRKCSDAGIKLAVISVLPVIHDLSVGKDYRNYYVKKINAAIKELAEKYGAEYIDCNEALSDENGQARADMFYDGVHPVGKGYDVIVDALRPFMEKYVK